MTLVRTLCTVPQPDGSRKPARGFFIWTPTRRRIISGSPDEVVEAVGFVVELKDGYFEVDAAPTDANWVWRVDEKIEGVRNKTIYVAVPALGPVDYTDLVQVNPSSFAPQAEPENIWYAYTDNLALEAQQAKVAAQNVELKQIVDASINADGELVFTRNDGTTFNAGRVVPRITIGYVESGQ